MTTLYLLAEGSNFPGEVLFSGCFEPIFQLKREQSLSRLLTTLEEEKQRQRNASLTLNEHENHHVVVMALPIEKVHGSVLQIKSIFPGAVCVSIIESKEEKDTKLFDWDCLFIQRPLNEFYVKSVIAAALRQSKLFNRLSQIGQFDEATSLYNQRYFMGRLADELALAQRHKENLSCIVFGIGYYAMFLDSYGYEFIHALYKHLAAIIQQHIRREDVIARVGDQEIGLLLPRSHSTGAKTLATRIINSVASRPFQYKSEEEELRLAAGIFGYPLQGEPAIDGDTAIRYARHALHRAQKDQDEEEESVVQIFSELYPVE